MIHTNTNINLTDPDSIGDRVYGSETGRALTVNGLEGRGVWNSSVESSHTCGSSTSTSWQHVANAYILDKLWVEVDGRVDGLENGGKHFLWVGILKTTLTSLRSDTLSVL